MQSIWFNEIVNENVQAIHLLCLVVFMNLLLSNILTLFLYNFHKQTTQLKNKTLYFVYLFMAILLCELKRMFNVGIGTTLHYIFCVYNFFFIIILDCEIWMDYGCLFMAMAEGTSSFIQYEDVVEIL